MYAHSSNPFLEFCPSTPSISSFILFYIFDQAFDTLKIPEHRCGAWDPLKKVICLSILLLFFLLLCHFHLNMNIQNSWSNWVSTYHWQFSTCNHFHVKWLTNPRWPHSFQQQLFPSVHSLVYFKCIIIFRSFHLDFLCANLAAPNISYHLFSNFHKFHFASHVIHPGICSPAPSSVDFNSPIILKSSSSSSRVRVLPLQSLRTICFLNLGRDAYDSTLKTPLPPSPACFNHLIILKTSFLSQSAHSQPWRSERRHRTHCQRWDSPWRLCQD